MSPLCVDRLVKSTTAMRERSLLKLSSAPFLLPVPESKLPEILANAFLVCGSRHSPLSLLSLSCSRRLEPPFLFASLAVQYSLQIMKKRTHLTPHFPLITGFHYSLDVPPHILNALSRSVHENFSDVANLFTLGQLWCRAYL